MVRSICISARYPEFRQDLHFLALVPFSLQQIYTVFTKHCKISVLHQRLTLTHPSASHDERVKSKKGLDV